MELNEKDYVLCFALGDIPGSDFLLTCKKDEQNWYVEYRFRYHRDKLVFDSTDKKSFYAFKTDGNTPEEEMLDRLNKFLDVIRKRYENVEITLVQGDVDKFAYMLAQSPSAHIKRIGR